MGNRGCRGRAVWRRTWKKGRRLKKGDGWMDSEGWAVIRLCENLSILPRAWSRLVVVGVVVVGLGGGGGKGSATTS